MLQNNLDPEVAERPDDLVVYGGTGRAARSLGRLRRHVPHAHDAGRRRDDARAVGQARRRVPHPRVGAAGAASPTPTWCPSGATWDEFRRLEALGLTMYGQMTAGSWIYIGTQGILQGTYECFAEIARRRFGGTLAGTITLTAGLGGMGGAQPLAVTMNDGVALCIEVDAHRIERRLETALPRRGGRLARRRRSPAATGPRDERRALSVGLLGNAAECCPAAARARLPGRHRDRPDQRPRPAQLRARPTSRPRRPPRWRRTDPDELHPPVARESWPPTARAMVGFLDARQRGLRLRQQPAHRGPARRLRAGLRLPGLPPGLHPAAVLRGQGPVPLGGAVGRPGRHRRHRPGRARGVPRRRRRSPAGSSLAGERVAFQGLPARICWLGYGERHRLGLRFNEMVRTRSRCRRRS